MATGDNSCAVLPLLYDDSDAGVRKKFSEFRWLLVLYFIYVIRYNKKAEPFELTPKS